MWQPLKEPVFRALWIAAFVSNIGSLMQDVGSAWLMTSLTKEPLMVALLQTASNAPFFLLALLAGTLADVIDRRKLLIIGQWWMGIAALILGIITLAGMANPWSLLALTFLLGLGAAVTSPAWNALIPELVPREQLEQAIALGSVGYNTARGVGSAVGGIVVAAAGSGAVFMTNAVSFLGVLGVMYWWKRPPEADAHATREPLLGAMRAGMRFAQYSLGLRAVFVKTAIWATGASAIWALLPLIAREKLHLDAIGYGMLLSAFGLGTLIGAFLMPRLRRDFSLEATARCATLLWMASMALMAWPVNFWLAFFYMTGLGIAWVIVNSCLNVGAQLSVPSWVRARALALYILVFQGSVAIGSSIWGEIGNHTGLAKPLLFATLLLGVGQIAGARYHLGVVENFDTTPSGHWKDPSVVNEPTPEQGPVLVTVEYTIDPARGSEFTKAIAKLGLQRKRDGAYQWHIFTDLSQPSRYVETFMIETWGEHVRQHERVMNADVAAEQMVDSFHVGDKPIVVRHMISSFAVTPPSQVPPSLVVPPGTADLTELTEVETETNP
jgi:MFS family permease